MSRTAAGCNYQWDIAHLRGAIYAQPRGELLRRQFIACLRHGRSTRLPRKCGADRR